MMTQLPPQVLKSIRSYIKYRSRVRRAAGKAAQYENEAGGVPSFPGDGTSQQSFMSQSSGGGGDNMIVGGLEDRGAGDVLAARLREKRREYPSSAGNTSQSEGTGASGHDDSLFNHELVKADLGLI